MVFQAGFQAKADHSGDELKRQLSTYLEEREGEILKVAGNFYTAKRTDQNYVALCQKIVKMVDDILAAGDWESSLFLRNTIKPLKEIRQEAVELLEELLVEGVGKGLTLPELSENTAKVYVSLYQARGDDLASWEAQLASLDKFMVGRPIYSAEEEIRQATRFKTAQSNEAYAVVALDKSKIIASDPFKVRKDRLGNFVISVVEGSVSAENVLEFVHAGKRYYFRNNRLIPQ